MRRDLQLFLVEALDCACLHVASAPAGETIESQAQLHRECCATECVAPDGQKDQARGQLVFSVPRDGKGVCNINFAHGRAVPIGKQLSHSSLGPNLER